jgi:hypothetical protein
MMILTSWSTVTILTGYWPCRTRAFFGEGDDYLDYVDRVNLLFSQGQYPDVDGLWGGDVMMGCWRKEFTTAEQILEALDTQMPTDGVREAIS